jgi:hypothetical protein
VLAQEKAQQCLPGGKLLRAAGYETFAADSVSKEMFLADMGKKDNSDIDLDLETLVSDAPTECYVMAEEFNDFIGQGDLPFVTRLTKLWDCPAEFRHPKLHGKSVYVYKPTVNILGANTQQNFSMAIPPEAIGNGFCSRFLFIHSEPTGKFITFPDEDNKELRDALVERLKKIRDLWKVVSKDLNKFTELQEILQGLNKADKVQIVKVGSKQGYLPKNVVEEKWDNSLLNMDYLTQEEQDS